MEVANSNGFLSFADPIMSKFFLRQQTPWISLSLLFLSYAAQGYILAPAYQSLVIYINVGIVYFLSQIILLNSWTRNVGMTIKRWVGSDAIHVIGSLVTIFLISFLLSYLELFENLLFVLAAELLARLDLQQVELNQAQKITILTMCLMLGLTMGWIVSGRLLDIQHESQTTFTLLFLGTTLHSRGMQQKSPSVN